MVKQNGTCFYQLFCVCVRSQRLGSNYRFFTLYINDRQHTHQIPLLIFTFNFNGHKCKLQNWTFFWLIKCPSLSPRSPVSTSSTNYSYPQADKSSQSYPLQLHDWFVNTRKHPANHPLCSRWVLKKWKDIWVGEEDGENEAYRKIDFMWYSPNKCIKERIMMGNKAYYANRQLVNRNLISRNSKLQI